MTNTEKYTLATMQEFVGRELGVTDWVTIEQGQINQFADCTHDHQWIHVDVERATKESPFGSTIAHGLLTLSLLPAHQFEIGVVPEDASQAFNYGFNKVRFMAPVKVGARVRNRVVLSKVEDKGNGRWLVTTNNTLEIEGGDKPALVAESLAMVM